MKIGVLGLGARGQSLIKNAILPALQEYNMEIAAIYDPYADRVQRASKLIFKKTGKHPIEAKDQHVVLQNPEIQGVIIASSWEAHIELAVEAMKAGKYVGLEVGGAYTIEDCWKLVDTYEQTRTPIMLLENCCYGRRELMVLNMVRTGLFGEIVHCSGGYMHDLRDEVSGGKEYRHYRLRNYLNRNCENYPTHELGPIAKVLDINRGNRMVSLVSMSSKAAGLHDYIKQNDKADKALLKQEFMQGDIVTTVIRCAHGQTITLTLDTTLPRPYSRGFTVRGTKGMYQEDNQSVFLDEMGSELHFKWQEQWGNADQYLKKYQHPIWTQYLEEGVKEGHDGMDYLVLSAFFESVRNRTQTPIDVYDAASWMCISALSEDSIACGGALVSIPDFTNGKWLLERPVADAKYRLD